MSETKETEVPQFSHEIYQHELALLLSNRYAVIGELSKEAKLLRKVVAGLENERTELDTRIHDFEQSEATATARADKAEAELAAMKERTLPVADFVLVKDGKPRFPKKGEWIRNDISGGWMQAGFDYQTDEHQVYRQLQPAERGEKKQCEDSESQPHSLRPLERASDCDLSACSRAQVEGSPGNYNDESQYVERETFDLAMAQKQRWQQMAEERGAELSRLKSDNERLEKEVGEARKLLGEARDSLRPLRLHCEVPKLLESIESFLSIHRIPETEAAK